MEIASDVGHLVEPLVCIMIRNEYSLSRMFCWHGFLFFDFITSFFLCFYVSFMHEKRRALSILAILYS